MESRIQRVFLGALLLVAAATSMAQSSDEAILDKIVSPDIERRSIVEDNLDTEDFEVGVFAGIMSIEDFGSNVVSGARFAYHISENFFMEASYGQTEAEETSFELLSGSTEILTDRNLSYYNLSVGYNLFTGEFFFGSKRAYNSNVYIIAGAGNTDFGGDEYFTYNFGTGIRFFFSDWIALHMDVRDHIFDHSILGEGKNCEQLGSPCGTYILFFNRACLPGLN